MLEIEEQLIKIAHVNVRTEKHGDDDVLAVDLKLQARMSNDVLSQLSPSLKSSFYHKDDSIQGDIIDEPGYLPNLKNPSIGPVKWAGKKEHQRLVIHNGVRRDDDIVLADSKADKLTLDLQEGGTVLASMRVQVLPDETTAAKLLALLNQEVHMSLSSDEPPEPDLDA